MPQAPISPPRTRLVGKRDLVTHIVGKRPGPVRLVARRVLVTHLRGTINPYRGPLR